MSASGSCRIICTAIRTGRSTASRLPIVSIDVTFELGTDPDLAAIYTQNRVAIAEPRLPPEVTRQGIKTRKRSTSFVQIVSVYAQHDAAGHPINPAFDELFLGNFVEIYIKDRLTRVPGVGEVFVFGGKHYAMHIWLDPEKLAARDLTTVDLLNALREQNVQVSGGKIGQEPATTESGFEYTVTTLGRLDSVQQFEAIVVKVGENQRVVRVKDVAGSNSAARTTPSRRRSMANPPRRWASTSSPAPTRWRWRWRRALKKPWPNSRPTSCRASPSR